MSKTLTPNYSLGKWDDGDNPGATDLNANWTTLDTQVYRREIEILTLDADAQVDLNAISNKVQLRTVATKTAAYSVTSNDLGTHFNNSGAGAQVVFTLPAIPATLGYSFTFVVLTAQNVRIAPGNSTDQIRNAGSVSTASTGYIENATVGGVVTVVAEAAGLWVCTSTVGTWTVV